MRNARGSSGVASTPSGVASNPGRVRPARLGSYATELQLLAGLAVLYAVFALAYPSQFATGNNLKNMTQQGGVLLVVAVAQMFALVVGGFDISVGANMGFVSVVAALGMLHQGGLAAGVAMGIAAGAAVGLVNGVLIAVLRITPFIATLAMLTFLGGLANHLSHGASEFGLPKSLSYLGGGDWGPIPSALALALIVVTVAWVVLARLRLGLYIYAIGGSRETCRVAGVPVVWYEIATYTITGTLAGLAGVMLASRVGVGQANLGQGYELLSIATAVIGGAAIGGGAGRLTGVILGVALLTVLTTGLDIAGVAEFTQQMVIGAVLVAAVFFSGLRGGGLVQGSWIRSSDRKREGQT